MKIERLRRSILPEELLCAMPEGLLAKAQAARAAMHADVPEYLTDTFSECADYHDLLADSLCRDLLGRAGA